MSSHSIKKGMGYLAHVLSLLGALVLAVMTAVTLFDVGRRTLFNSPLFGANEFVGLCLAVITMTGLAHLALKNNHISVTLLESLLFKMVPRTYVTVLWGVNVIGMAFIFWMIYDFALDVTESSQRTVILRWPMSYLAWTLTVLGGVGALFAVLSISKVMPCDGRREDA
ncbi:TRAP transporter small permease [Halomonas alkalicola]|uniref:TRAP transporter small permease n=1 Tax=Halomonas alkalicola TaxID=1930622 RepID=UPI00265EBCD5|nr:TRAP transporter small permease [Halomonas alkalicola]